MYSILFFLRKAFVCFCIPSVGRLIVCVLKDAGVYSVARKDFLSPVLHRHFWIDLNTHYYLCAIMQ